MKRKNFLIGLPLIFILLMAIMALRPTPTVTLEEANQVQGQVESVTENSATGDISIQLKNKETQFYINRGIEKGLTAKNLSDQLVDETVTLYFPKHWTPLDPFGKVKHISRIALGEALVYDEMKG